jgi:hypothetical protein
MPHESCEVRFLFVRMGRDRSYSCEDLEGEMDRNRDTRESQQRLRDLNAIGRKLNSWTSLSDSGDLSLPGRVAVAWCVLSPPNGIPPPRPTDSQKSLVEATAEIFTADSEGGLVRDLMAEDKRHRLGDRSRLINEDIREIS